MHILARIFIFTQSVCRIVVELTAFDKAQSRVYLLVLFSLTIVKCKSEFNPSTLRDTSWKKLKNVDQKFAL